MKQRKDRPDVSFRFCNTGAAAVTHRSAGLDLARDTRSLAGATGVLIAAGGHGVEVVALGPAPILEMLRWGGGGLYWQLRQA
jgi:hypothetical protein